MIIVQESTLVAPKTRNNVVYLVSKIDTGEVVYVGKTIRIHERISEHKNKSRWEKTKFSVLYKAFKKYGTDVFKFEIFSCYKKEQDAFDMEVKLISIIKPRYNLTIGGDGGNASREMWKEWCEGTEREFKPVKAFNLTTQEVFSFESFNDASRDTGVNVGAISSIVKEIKFSCSGWTFSEKETPNWESLIIKIKRGAKKAVKATNTKTGEVLFFDSIKDASTQFKGQNAGIVRVCKGKQKTSGGHYWEYV